MSTLKKIMLPLTVLLAITSLWPPEQPSPLPRRATAQLPVDVVPLRQLTLAPLVERVTPAVVNIAVAQPSPLAQNPLLRDPYFRRFFGVPDAALRPRLSAGSGVIVDAGRGLVLTNHHVVAAARAIEVTLKDRRRVRAELVGSDPATDIAVLRIEARNLTALPLGDSDKLQVGDYVVAVGNPFGLGQTVTAGIVSALGRGLTLDGYESYIQTDAPIHPGNSGGALVSMRGELVGINTAIIGPAGGNVGIGFAVPANIARSVMEQIVSSGEVRRGQIGVGIQDLTPEILAVLGEGAPREGVVITAVNDGSAAARAGLKQGDIVVAVNGRPVLTAAELRNAVGLTPLGNRLVLDVVRRGKRLRMSVRVQTMADRGAEARASWIPEEGLVP